MTDIMEKVRQSAEPSALSFQSQALFRWTSRRAFGGPERHSAALLGFPVMVALCICVAVFRDYVGMALASHYWASLVTSANSFILAICPIVAGCAAWDVASLRRGGIMAYPAVVSHPAVLSRAVAPAVVAGWVCLIGVWLFMLPAAWGLPSAADLVTLAAASLIVLAYGMFGMMMSVLLPVVFAVPTALFFSYCWMVLPSAMEPVWLRHLNGFEDGCCNASDALSLRAAIAPVVMAVGVMLTCALLVGASLRASVTGWRGHDAVVVRRARGAAIAWCVSVAAAVALVFPFGVYPVVARATPTVCESRLGVTVCVWPEHRAFVQRLFRPAATLRKRLAEAGYDTPARLSESTVDRAAWLVSVDGIGSSDAETAENLLADLLTYDTTQNGCEASDSQMIDYMVAESWMIRASGLRMADGSSAMTASERKRLATLSLKPQRAQARWVATVLRGLRQSCNGH